MAKVLASKRVNVSFEVTLPRQGASSSSLSHFYVGSIWDDSRFHAARSYTSSPNSPFSLSQIVFHTVRPPLLRSSSPSASLHFYTLHPLSYELLNSSHHMPVPSHPGSWIFFEISPTFVLPLCFPDSGHPCYNTARRIVFHALSRRPAFFNYNTIDLCAWNRWSNLNAIAAVNLAARCV